MVTIEDYIKTKLSDIQRFSQQDFSWDNYRAIPQSRQPLGFQAFLQTQGIPERLHRDWIIEQFGNREKYYNGFVAAMLWGGINANRPVKGQAGNVETTNFHKAFSVPKEKITENLEQTRLWIAKDKIYELHAEYQDGKFKIPGVGESFFTKLLFFAGMNTTNPVKPLIYDKWTKIMHIWILLSHNDFKKIDRYFSLKQIQNGLIWSQTPGLLYTKPGDASAAYMDYVQKMNQLAHSSQLNVSNVEGYLFGNAMRGQANKDPRQNPRVFMVEQIKKGWREKIQPLL